MKYSPSRAAGQELVQTLKYTDFRGRGLRPNCGTLIPKVDNISAEGPVVTRTTRLPRHHRKPSQGTKHFLVDFLGKAPKRDAQSSVNKGVSFPPFKKAEAGELANAPLAL